MSFADKPKTTRKKGINALIDKDMMDLLKTALISYRRSFYKGNLRRIYSIVYLLLLYTLDARLYPR